MIKETAGSERFIISRLITQTNKRIPGIGLATYTSEHGLLISLEANGVLELPVIIGPVFFKAPQPNPLPEGEGTDRGILQNCTDLIVLR